MNRFNVGDVVREADGSSAFGLITVTEPGPVFTYGNSGVDADIPNYRGYWRNDKLELVTPANTDQQAAVASVDSDELIELRKFRDEAIAKYPDLAPMSEEDVFLCDVLNRYYNEDPPKPLSYWTEYPRVLHSFIREAIQWGREHAAK